MIAPPSTTAGTPLPRIWPAFGTAGCDETYLYSLANSVDARDEAADEKVLLLLKNLYVNGGRFSPQVRNRVEASILGFRYQSWEPGDDSMPTWAEHDQLVLGVAEYLAGQTFPERTFGNDGRSGERHRRSAEVRLLVWLSDRFRFGFSEWLSNIYYAVDAGALALLIDHAGDALVVAKASIVLDLLMFDLALHGFDASFGSAMATSCAEQQKRPHRSLTQVLWCDAFGAGAKQLPITELVSLFVTRKRYRVPETLREIAHSKSVVRARISQGLDVGEVADQLRHHPEFPRSLAPDQALFFWGMQAMVRPESIAQTMAMYRSYNLGSNKKLKSLAVGQKVPKALLAAAVRASNPQLSGSALQRGNVQTFKTHSYALSSAQHYHPGEFGDHQHLWHACLPGGIAVFGNHPRSSTFRAHGQSSTPNSWVGNGINPDIGQHDNVLLASYDLRPRRGLLEGRRARLVHIYFPFVRFDETRLGERWVAGRRNNSYIALLGVRPFEVASETEIVQRGDTPAYAVVLSDEEEFTSMGDFVRHVKSMILLREGACLRLVTAFGVYQLGAQGLRVAGRLQSSDY